MGEVIQLKEWIEQKEEEEIDDLAKTLKSIVDNLDLSDISNPIYTTMGYNEIGLSTSNFGITLDNNLKSCITNLAWISYILSGLGHLDASNDLDNIITRLEDKQSEE